LKEHGLKIKEVYYVKRKIFTVMLTLVLVLSFGLMTATPAGAVAPDPVKALKWDGDATANNTRAYYYYHPDSGGDIGENGSMIHFIIEIPDNEDTIAADFTALGGPSKVEAVFSGDPGTGHWDVTWDWAKDGVDQKPDVYEVPLTSSKYGDLGPFMVININPPDEDATLKGETTDWKTDIDDFTAVEDLTFEKFDGTTSPGKLVLGATSLGKLVIHGPVNLCDEETGKALADLGTNLNIAAAEMSLNTAADALIAFQGAATLYMYDLPFAEIPQIIYTPVGGDPQVVVQGGTGTILNPTLVSSCSYDAGTGTLTLTVNSWSTYTAVAMATVPDVVRDYSIKGSIKFFDWKCNKWIVVQSGTLHITYQDEENPHKIKGYFEPGGSIEGWPTGVPVDGYVGPFERDAKYKIKNKPRLSLLAELGAYCEYPGTKYVTYILNATITMNKKTEAVKSMKCTINGWGEFGPAFADGGLNVGQPDGGPSVGQFEGKFTATPLPIQ
jgi:hypothetical protein